MSDKSECPVKNSTKVDSESKCPIKSSEPSSEVSFWSWATSFWSMSGNSAQQTIRHNESIYNPQTNDYIFDGNIKDKDQKKKLETIRAVSSIPKGDYVPHHQPKNVERWVYPSEQQYFNAMRKKGFNPQERDVPVILAIHNTVNEEAWSRIKEWEELRQCKTPKLARFTGRPKDISPKAYLRSLMGYSLPFDRHDWYISRNGTEVRYVIDFYKGAQSSSTQSKDGLAPIALYMDVRPAVDSFEAVFDRSFVSVRDGLFGKPKASAPAVATSTEGPLGKPKDVPLTTTPSATTASKTVETDSRHTTK